MFPFRPNSRLTSAKPSFGEVVEKELQLLLRVALRMTQDESTAEDLVSQTLIRSHSLWHEFDGKHARSWLIKLMNNEWLNLNRKQQMRATLDIDSAEKKVDETFWMEVDSNLESQKIHHAIDQLPEDFRLALMLCDIEELTYQEAAHALNTNLGVIRTRVFRARKMLRSILVQDWTFSQPQP